MRNSEAFERHEKAVIALAEAWGNEDDPGRAKRIRQVLGRAREEHFQMLVAHLKQNTTTYQVITPRFRAAKADLVWTRKKAEEFKLAADRIASLIGWATKFIPLVA